MNGKDIGVTRISIDPTNLPEMSAERAAAIGAIRDEDIDYSDIPPQAGKLWRTVLGPHTAPDDAIEATLVLESDVVTMFRERGELTASRINAVLREYAEARRKTA